MSGVEGRERGGMERVAWMRQIKGDRVVQSGMKFGMQFNLWRQC